MTFNGGGGGQLPMTFQLSRFLQLYPTPLSCTGPLTHITRWYPFPDSWREVDKGVLETVMPQSFEVRWGVWCCPLEDVTNAIHYCIHMKTQTALGCFCRNNHWTQLSIAHTSCLVLVLSRSPPISPQPSVIISLESCFLSWFMSHLSDMQHTCPWAPDCSSSPGSQLSRVHLFQHPIHTQIGSLHWRK